MPTETTRLPRLVRALLAIVFAAVLVRTAWLSDDAAITLRTVLNVTHGYGPTFNIAERVQSYTHPLWMLLLTVAYLLARNVYYATFLLSGVLSVLVFWRLVTKAATAAQAWLAVAVLLFSRAFVDYSTSGLENPLSNLLLVAWVGLFLNDQVDRRRWLTGLWALASLLYLARPDNVLLVLPLLGLACARAGRAGVVVRSAAVGLVPAAAWTAFAIVYYGFPFPNTAYAKLATGIPTGERWTQGVLYLFDSVDRDPVTLAVAALAVAAALAERSAVGRAVAAGIVLSLGYVVSVGGDFMAGRFLVGAFVLAVLALTRIARAPSAAWVTLAVVLAALGATASSVPLLSDSRFDDKGVKPNGVVDERAMYFATRSLVRATRITFEEPDWPQNRGAWPSRFNVLDTCGLLGDGGLGWGPFTHMLDTCGLADPLMARLPAVFNPNWRVGHYRRMIPVGYAEGLATSENRLADPLLREYYEQLRLVTRSRPLLSRTRLRAIWRMNTGRLDRLIDRVHYRHHGAVASLADVAAVKEDGTPRDGPGVRDLSALPLAVTCEARPGRRTFDVSLDSDDRYIVTFLRDAARVGTLELGPIPEYRRQPGLYSYTVDVPPRARERGFDALVFTGVRGDGKYALGHLLLDGTPATDPELQRRVARRDGLAR